MDAAARNPQLDGVRGIAILMVLVWHYYASEASPDLGGSHRYLLAATHLFWSGVDLFFVLSGFLIAGILIDQRGSANCLRVFYIRRACRILPMYVVMLLLYLVARALLDPTSPAHAWLFGTPISMLNYVTFTQNFVMGWSGTIGGYWLGVTWSLALEEQFYLLVPLLFLFADRRTAAYMLLIGIGFAILMRIMLPGYHVWVSLPWRADALLCGAGLAIAVRSESFVNMINQHRAATSLLFATLVAGAGVMSLRPEYFGALAQTWLALLYGLLVLFASLGVGGWLGALLGSRPLAWLGQISFAVYLLHQPVNGLLHGLLLHKTPALLAPLDGAVTFAALLTTLALAWASFHVLEAPMLRYGRRFRFARPTRLMTAAT